MKGGVLIELSRKAENLTSEILFVGHEIQTILTKELHALGMVYNVGWSQDTDEQNYLTVNHTVGQGGERTQQISVFRISMRPPNLEGGS